LLGKDAEIRANNAVPVKLKLRQEGTKKDANAKHKIDSRTGQICGHKSQEWAVRRRQRGHQGRFAEPRMRREKYEAKLTALQAAIDAGDNSGVVEGDVFSEIRSQFK
jgi:hypothetical protein